MNITEVKIFKKETSDKKLRAFATVTFDDCFVVRDLKIIEGNKGLFVAMPSRRMKDPCPSCGHRNVVRSKFCNNCGKPQEIKQAVSRQDEHKDIAHPITLDFREAIQKAVLDAYEKGVDYSRSENQANSGRTVASPGADYAPIEDIEL